MSGMQFDLSIRSLAPELLAMMRFNTAQWQKRFGPRIPQPYVFIARQAINTGVAEGSGSIASMATGRRDRGGSGKTAARTSWPTRIPESRGRAGPGRFSPDAS
jgi:hypothetical protein